LNKSDLNAELFDITGKSVIKNTLLQGSTISFFDVSTLYLGIYFLKVGNKTIEVKVGE
jgi:hypothetical protein